MPLTSAAVLDTDFDVCVVGAGPAGLACALHCHDAGLKVLVLEAGGMRPSRGRPDILAAEVPEPRWHEDTDSVSASALGGTSHWWGGRVVPFDPVDFETWPIRYEEMTRWYEAAAGFLGVSAPSQSPPPDTFSRLKDFDASCFEAWGPGLNIARRWRERIASHDGPAIVLNARVTELAYQHGAIARLHVRIGDETRSARARCFVLACGGLGGLRLLLLMQQKHPTLMGGREGPLGRGYMGHLTGAIADIALTNPRDIDAFCFWQIAPNVFGRRHIHAREETVKEHRIGHIAFWLETAELEDAAHGSPIASAKYLIWRAFNPARSNAASGLGDHLTNIGRAPLSAAAGVAHSAYLGAMARMSGRRRCPPPFLQSRAGAWRLLYHSEQRPDQRNRVQLSERTTDSLGLPALRISFRYSADDVDSVVRAHEVLAADMEAAGAGRLLWRGSRAHCVDGVRDAARDGYHQLGGAPMGHSAKDAVVAADCRVFGVENLWVASGSVFPTGGRANPTLTIVAIACRIAASIARPQAATA